MTTALLRMSMCPAPFQKPKKRGKRNYYRLSIDNDCDHITESSPYVVPFEIVSQLAKRARRKRLVRKEPCAVLWTHSSPLHSRLALAVRVRTVPLHLAVAVPTNLSDTETATFPAPFYLPNAKTEGTSSSIPRTSREVAEALACLATSPMRSCTAVMAHSKPRFSLGRRRSVRPIYV